MLIISFSLILLKPLSNGDTPSPKLNGLALSFPVIVSAGCSLSQRAERLSDEDPGLGSSFRYRHWCIAKVLLYDTYCGPSFFSLHPSNEGLAMICRLSQLDRNTIFFEFALKFSTTSIALEFRDIPSCITPHKSIM